MPKAQKSSEKIDYFATSVKRLALLSFFTTGIYQIYWFYRNWNAIKQAKGLSIQPVWRGIFSIFWAYALFKEMLKPAEVQGYKSKFSAQQLAVFYIAACVAGSVVGWGNYALWVLGVTLGFMALSILPLMYVQRVVNQKLKPSTFAAQKSTRNEKIIIGVGYLVFILFLLAFLVPSDPVLTPEQQGLYDKSNALMAEYDDCSTALKLREGSLNTDNQEAVDAFNADVDKCEAIRVQQNEAADKYDASVGL